MRKRSVRSASRSWFSVRCVFANRRVGRTAITYEERITVWQTASAAAAIRLAEGEARSYARSMSKGGDTCRYLGFAESYETSLRRLTQGDEIFSLLRDSRLDGGRYLDRYFDTGKEHRTRAKPGGQVGSGIQPNSSATLRRPAVKRSMSSRLE